MEDRKKTIIAVAIVIVFLFLLLIILGSFVFRRKTVSPIPDDTAIKIIFISPTFVPPVSSISAEPVLPSPSKKP